MQFTFVFGDLSYLLTKRWPFDATAIGRTKDALEDAVESRLRTAHPYTMNPSQAGSALLIELVDLNDERFSVSVESSKRVFDEFGESGNQTIWTLPAPQEHRVETQVSLSRGSRSTWTGS